MKKKILVHLLNIALLLQIGCTSSSKLQIDEYSDEYKNEISRVILKDSTEYELGKDYNIKGDTLFIYDYEIYLQTGTYPKKIPLNDISLLVCDSFDLGRTLILCAAGVGVVVLVALIIYLENLPESFI